MLFKSVETTDVLHPDLDVHSKKKRHAELLNAAQEAEQVINTVVNDNEGIWRLCANGVEYAATSTTIFAIGHTGATIQCRQTVVKMASDSFTAIVAMHPSYIMYIETVKDNNGWRTAADITIKKDDWRDDYHEERGIVLSAVTYLTDELRAVNNLVTIPQESLTLPLPRMAVDDLAKLATHA
jgi:hypothetical protein